MNKLYIITICIFASASILYAEIVQFEPCHLPEPAQCTIHEVRVSPCPHALQNKPCQVKRGRSASIAFDYTADFDSTSAHGQVYSVTQDADLPFLGMNTEACEHTTCPINKSTKQTYNYTLHVAKKFPVAQYTIKWILRNPDKPETSTEMCCFTTKVKLTK